MLEEKQNGVKWDEMTISEKIRNVINNITVEPLMFFHVVPSVFAGLATQNLNLEKACRVNLNYSDEVCSALRSRQTENFKTEEKNVQKLVASMSIWTTPLRSSIPALLIMFLGSWSDRKKRRKPFMLIPILGEFLTCVGLLVCVYFFYELPMEVAGFVESFFPAVTGGWITMFMAVFSYMGDVTSVEMRTVRIGVLNLCGSVGFPLGTALSGVALKAIGFYGIFLISAVMYLFSITYGMLRIKETPSTTQLDTGKVQSESQTNTFAKKPAFSLLLFLKEFFDFKHIKETFSVVFRNASNNRRKRIILLIVAQTFIIVAGHDYTVFRLSLFSVFTGERDQIIGLDTSREMSLIYLFMRYRFNWDEVKFSMFATYSVIVHIFGTSLSVGVLSHLLKCDDAVIGGLSCISKILSGLVFAFAQHEWQVYLVPLVDILNGTSSIALRSITSKIVPTDELGKLNAVYGACEALTPLLHGPLFALVYARTMDTMPGAFLLLGGALTLPPFFIFCWMYTQHRKFRHQNDHHQSRKTSLVEEVPTHLSTSNSSVDMIPHGTTDRALGKLNLGFEDSYP